MSENHEKIVFFDTEISTEGNKIYDIGAVSEYVEFHSPSLDNFLKIVKGAEYICGHNIIEYDLKILNSKILNSKKKIDTLFFSPLLFPTHPYHNLVKDDKLQIEDLNNPLNDSKTARKLFFEEVDAFSKLNTNLKNIYCNLLYQFDEFKDFFIFYGIKPRTGFFSSYPDVKDTELLIFKEFEGRICENADIKSIIRRHPIELAYALSLIRTTDYHSITPPWVLKKYPRVENIITLLCHTKCSKWCKYCSSKLDIRKRLKDFLGFESFKLYNGENLQEKAVQAAVDGKSLLAVFPTGGGKSLTFQLPALIAGEERRGLTVVISPLQSLMKDQVDKLNDMGLVDAVSINGLLSPIERSEAIDRVRSGLATILYIAPESLRSNTIEKLIFDRSVVRFVVDEAHCFSAWGQDFRVDYLYIAEFIRKYQKVKNIKVNIPVSCFTATAKQKVVSDICDYFRKNLGLNLERFSTSFQRINLHYNVLYKESDEEKYIATRTLLTQKNCPTIIYVSRTKRTFEIAQKLTQDGYLALPYNGKMSSDEKISNQDKFINGQVNIIVATSAFGMGVDKKDVKLVIHYDISDSLENYVQEAGRAGRDENIEAECYVLFNENDLDKHFVLLNQTKLSMAEIAQVWKAIKSLTNEKHRTIFSSPLEIARQAGWDGVDNELEIRVKTAIAALENAGYIKRKKNCPKIFATSILVKNMAEAVAKIDKISNLDDKEKESAKRIIKHLISSKYKMRNTDCEAESRVDYLSDILGISKELCIKIINLLRLDGILDDYKDMTGYIQVSATNRNIGLQTLNQYIKLEEFILKNMRENESVYSLKELNENAKKVDIGHSSVKKIDILLNYLSIKGYVYKKESGDRNYVQLVPKENLSRLFEKYNIRVDVCRFIIEYLYSHQEQSNIIANTTKSEALVQFSLNELYNGYLSSSRIFPFKQKVSLSDIEDCLLYLIKIKTLKIERGFFVLYSALEIQRIIMDNRIRYKNEDYKLLDEHYKQKIQQIHIVGEYANLLVKDYNSALVFVSDYFQMDFKAFIQKYFYGEREKEINRNITVSKYRRLFETLSPIQKEIIDDKNSKYIVICAGPGSGKTRVLVHKLSSLLMLEDVRHEQLLMLAFSRAAVSEFKKRIFELMGNAINYIDIKTFHSYCFDLLGRVGDLEKSENIVQEALKMIDQGLSDIDERILTKTVLVVDEAQDMDENDYACSKNNVFQ